MRWKPCAEHPFAVVDTRGAEGKQPITVGTARSFEEATRVKRRLRRIGHRGKLVIIERIVRAHAPQG